MIISNIELRQFRNYTHAQFDFSPGVTVITGNNGVGKTNILEALYVLALGSSFRDADPLLINHGCEGWRLTGVVDDNIREVRYDGKKSYRINDTAYSRLPFRYHLPVVLFEPEDLLIVHGSPRLRRTYLDRLIAVITPGYAALLRRYERVIAQRNKLLKQQYLNHDSLFVWDISLAELATKIVEARQLYIDGWKSNLSTHYQLISESQDTIDINYHSIAFQPGQYTQSILHHLKTNIDRDVMTGITSVGPHRDDYEFLLNTRNMAHVASRGEVRTLLLSLVFYSAEVLHELHGEKPIVLLDDVLSELDSIRQRKVTDEFTYQTVITTASAPRNSHHHVINL
jgi:DNA replication and repair protein RecF